MSDTATTPQNREVAAALGLSESGASRLRTGSRLPSLDTMQVIEDVYGWTVQNQSNARKNGQWTELFEKNVRRGTLAQRRLRRR